MFGGLGNNNNTNNAPKPGLFGSIGASTTNTQQPQQQSNLFGGASTSAPNFSFGAPATQQQPQQTTNAFGLGNSTNTGTGIGGFGSTTGGTGGFGGGNMFGTGSTLGQSQQQQQQPNLSASIDQGAYGNSTLFNSGTAAPGNLGMANGLDTSQLISKRPALPPLAASAYKSTPKRSQVEKLRGFASPILARSTPSSPLNLSVSLPGRSGSPIPSDRYKGLSDSSASPNAFLPRPSIKRLNVTPRLSSSTGSTYNDPLESVLGKSAIRSPAPSPAPQRQRLEEFSPSVQSPAASRYVERNGDRPQQDETSQQAPQTPQQQTPQQQKRSDDAPTEEGDYWCKPTIEKLRKMSRSDKERVKFSAGCKGKGEVRWDEEVDFNEIDLDQLLGTTVVFGDADVAVYPEDGPTKPPRGQGLNVPATISLEGIHCVDKPTKQIIRNQDDARYIKFVKRLQTIKRTEFVSYKDDVWTFKVEHFSRYGLIDSDEDEVDEAETAAMNAKKAIIRAQTRKTSGRFEELDRDQQDQDRDQPMPQVNGEEESDDGVLDVPPSKSMRDGPEANGYDGDDASNRTRDTDDSADETFELNEDEDGPDGQWDKSQSATGALTKIEKMRGMFSAATPDSPFMYMQPQPDVSALKRKAIMLSDIDAPLPLTPTRTIANNGTQLAQSQALVRQEGFGNAGEDIDSLDARAAKRSSSGAKTVSPPLLRQPRKYARVALEESVVGKQGAEVESVSADAGLGLGRSFRCSWGPNGELVYSGKIGGVKSSL